LISTIRRTGRLLTRSAVLPWPQAATAVVAHAGNHAARLLSTRRMTMLLHRRHGHCTRAPAAGHRALPLMTTGQVQIGPTMRMGLQHDITLREQAIAIADAGGHCHEG
jgi:hypothetical protein